MKYTWKITKDHTGGEDKGTEFFSCSHKEVDMNIKAHFSLYDDDGKCYFEGMLYGDCTGFEPLWDFGAPNAGCSRIKLNGSWL